MSWFSRFTKLGLLGTTANEVYQDKLKILAAKHPAKIARDARIGTDFREIEFSVFSQFGDDGIIQHLIGNLDTGSESFIEFGVANYRESNTRYLMMNNNWSGLVFDSSKFCIDQIQSSHYFWKHDLVARAAFVDAENINDLITESGFEGEIGLLHIDLDGMDYWVWKAITAISPVLVIMEYNAVFGPDRAITVPYDAGFNRLKVHHSGLYSGASLQALSVLGRQKGYSFFGCNSAGNNAYFLRDDRFPDNFQARSVSKGFVMSRFRESRNEDGQLSFLAGQERLREIKGLPVLNVSTGTTEYL